MNANITTDLEGFMKFFKKLSSGAMVSISDFDSDDVGSNPALITKIFPSSNGLGY